MSILLISKIPIEQLDGKTVALTNTSATSQVLTRIILEEKYGLHPSYFECPPDLGQMFREAESALLIGDDALRALQTPSGYHLYDLGEEWSTFYPRENGVCRLVRAQGLCGPASGKRP